MIVYLAAPYASKGEMSRYRDELTSNGISCSSSWIDERHDPRPGIVDAATDLDDATVAGYAWLDVLEVVEADVFVLFTAAYVTRGSASGGRHVETGLALGAGVPVLVVGGHPENIFHRMGEPEITLLPDWHHTLEALKARNSASLTGGPS